MSIKNLLICIFYISLAHLIVAHQMPKDDLVKFSKIRELKFFENEKTSGEFPRDQLNCYDEYLNFLCMLFAPSSIECVNKDGDFVCVAQLRNSIYLKNYNVNCEIYKNGYIDKSSCYLDYQLEQNALYISGPLLVSILLSTIIITCLAASLNQCKKHRCKKSKKNLNKKINQKTPILIHQKQPKINQQEPMTHYVNHSFVPYNGQFQNYNTNQTPYYNPNSLPPFPIIVNDLPPKYSKN